MISVLIVDDHTLVRETWTFILKTYPIIGEVKECADGVSALEYIQQASPDIILMDINMEPLNGVDTTRKMLESNPNLRIIGVSTYADPSTVRRMTDAGAKGYVTKSSPVQEMITAIQTVLNGGVYFCSELDGLPFSTN